MSVYVVVTSPFKLQVHSLDDLMQSHTKFLDNAIFRYMLYIISFPLIEMYT